MENEKIKGCVYFFKHVGLAPVKIGFSTNESPFSRFNAFKTYAPFGSELIGFIRTDKAKELETILHQKFSSFRLNGEWFDISKKDVDKCVKFYSDIEDIQEMNNFQVAWARKIQENNNNSNPVLDIFYNYFSEYKTEVFFRKVVLNQFEIIEKIKCSRNDLKEFLDLKGFKYKAHRVNNTTKKGYLLYFR